MKVAIPLAKNVLAPLGITAASSAIDAGIKKKQKNVVLAVLHPPRFANNNFNNSKRRNK